jgi:hypothetical protein
VRTDRWATFIRPAVQTGAQGGNKFGRDFTE